MSRFKIINNTSEIALNKKWAPATKFNSKNRLVDEKGHRLSSDYKGRQYRIIEKRERTFSGLERFGRGFLGTLAVVCTLGLGLSLKSVRNLFTRSKENIRFAVLASRENVALQKNSNVIPSKEPSKPSSEKTQKTAQESFHKNEGYDISEQELQQGISISEDTISKIQICMKNVLKRKEVGGLKFYNSQDNHRVFSLDTAPDLIFKMKANKNFHTIGLDDSMKARYQTMINSQTVVRTYKLGLLVIPNAKLFTVNVEGEEHEIIAERKVDINPHESAQEQYFQDYAESLNEAIRQLAIFICKTGYGDVNWRNNPVLNNSLDENGNRKIALIDLEEMDKPQVGLFGRGDGRRGLVRCVNEEQGKIVEAVAKQNGIKTSSFAEAYAARKEEIEEERKLKEYYTTKNITVGNELIQIDENSIDFSEYPEKIESLKNVTRDLVQAMNDIISKSPADESIKGRRHIYFNANTQPFQRLNNKLIDESINKRGEEYYEATYMGYVINKLIELGAVYKRINRNGYGYFLQA